MGQERNPESRKFVEQYADTDFLDAVRELNQDDGLPTTGDIARKVGSHRNHTRERLNDLLDDGQLERIKVGNAHVWKPNGE